MPQPPEQNAPRSGMILGDWIIDWEIGGGANGRVLRAHTPQGVHGALKVADDAAAWPRLAREAQVLARLHHPAFPRLLDQGRVGGLPYLVMELIEGRTVRSLLGVPTTWLSVGALVLQTARALAHAHGLGIHHRDLKPAHLVIQSDGRVRILDLGAADLRDAGRLTLTQVPATPAYAPPEWHAGGELDGAAADIFALGRVAWALLSGTRLAPADPMPPLGDDVPADLIAVLSRCQHRDPGRRPTADALAQALGEQGIGPYDALLDGTWTQAPAGESRRDPTSGPGDQLGRYEIRDLLGRGAMGVVHRAWDRTLQREVALKLSPILEQDDGRALREAQALARMSDPGIVRVLDVGEQGATRWFAMELVEGPTLAVWLQDHGAAPPERAARWVQALATAVQHAHDHGIVHRDVKPSNVLIDGDQPRLVDFGLARMEASTLGRSTVHGALVGTPAYMAPEQARGEGAGPASDVYGLGAVLYEALTGRPPFDGTHPAQVLHKVLHDAPTSLRAVDGRIPWALEVIATKAMSKAPRDRYADAAALAEDLRRWQAGESLIARPDPLARRVWRWTRRHRLPLTTAAALSLGIGLLAVVLGMPSTSGDPRADAARRELSALLSAPAHATPERRGTALQHFVDDPRTAGTPAAGEAWFHLGRLHLQADRLDAAEGALAAALPLIDDPQVRVATLVELATLRAQQARWPAFVAVATSLARSDAQVLARSPDAVRIVQDGALADRRRGVVLPPGDDVQAVQDDPLADLIDVRPLDLEHLLGVVDVDGDGIQDALGVAHDHVVAVDPTGAAPPLPLDPLDPDIAHFHARTDAQGASWFFGRVPGRSSIRAARWAGDHVEVLPDIDVNSSPSSLALVDPTGLGDPTLYIGTLDNVQTTRWTGDGWTPVTPASPDLEHVASEVTALRVADFNQDGVQDLISLQGAWAAFDVRALSTGPDGLRLSDRKLHGHVSFAADLDLGSGPGARPVLVAFSYPTWPSRTVFPEGDHFGAPPGVYLFGMDGPDLEQVAVLATPTPCTSGVAGDLTGDGLQDLAANCGGDVQIWIQEPDRTFQRPRVLRAVHVSAAIEADGDDRRELILRDRDGPFLIAGAGGEPLPPLPAGDVPGEPPPGLSGSAARVWSRAEDLVALDLKDQAAALLEQLAASAEGHTAAAARIRAATILFDDPEQVSRVQALLHAAGAWPAATAESLVMQIKHDRHHGAWPQAVERIERYRARPDRDAELARSLEQDLPDLRGEASRSRVHLVGPGLLQLAPRSPDGLRQSRDGLRLIGAGGDVLIDQAIQSEGHTVELRASLRIDRAEWGSTVGLSLSSGDEPVVGAGLQIRGGGGAAKLVLTAWPNVTERRKEVEWPWEDPAPPRDLELVVQRAPDGALRVTYRMQGEPEQELLRVAGGTRPTVDRVKVHSVMNEGGAQVMELLVRDLTLIGATPAPEQEPLDAPYRALTENRADDALALLPADAVEARIVALADLGRYREAGDLLRRNLPRLKDRLPRRTAVHPEVVRLAVPEDRWMATLFEGRAATWFQHGRDPRVVDQLIHLLPEPPDVRDVPNDTIFAHGIVYSRRGEALLRMGKVAMAAHQARFVIDLVDQRPGEDPLMKGRWPDGIRRRASLLLARVLLAQGAQDEAMDLLLDLLDTSLSPELVADRLLSDAAFDALHDRPGWQRIVLAQRGR